jgi:hypothetical protein
MPSRIAQAASKSATAGSTQVHPYTAVTASPIKYRGGPRRADQVLDALAKRRSRPEARAEVPLGDAQPGHHDHAGGGENDPKTVVSAACPVARSWTDWITRYGASRKNDTARGANCTARAYLPCQRRGRFRHDAESKTPAGTVSLVVLNHGTVTHELVVLPLASDTAACWPTVSCHRSV